MVLTSDLPTGGPPTDRFQRFEPLIVGPVLQTALAIAFKDAKQGVTLKEQRQLLACRLAGGPPSQRIPKKVLSNKPKQ